MTKLVTLLTVPLLIGAGSLFAGASGATRAACTITGTNASEKLVGTSGHDVICGKGGRDRIYGKGGGDTLYGGDGADKLDGAAGVDYARYEDRFSRLCQPRSRLRLHRQQPRR